MRLEVSAAVRHMYMSLGFKRLTGLHRETFEMFPASFFSVCFLSVIAKTWIILYFILFLSLLILRIAQSGFI